MGRATVTRYGWAEQVIGTHKAADSAPGAGQYGYWRLEGQSNGLKVVADVYPDFGTVDENGPHLWGVKFPEQKRLTEFDPKTNGSREKRPHLPEKRLGRKAPTREQAMVEAEECMRTGRDYQVRAEPREKVSDDVPEDD